MAGPTVLPSQPFPHFFISPTFPHLILLSIYPMVNETRKFNTIVELIGFRSQNKILQIGKCAIFIAFFGEFNYSFISPFLFPFIPTPSIRGNPSLPHSPQDHLANQQLAMKTTSFFFIFLGHLCCG
jgi:hypothetical protein